MSQLKYFKTFEEFEIKNKIKKGRKAVRKNISQVIPENEHPEHPGYFEPGIGYIMDPINKGISKDIQ